MIQFDGRIFFQMGWFNHQLDGVEATIPVDGSEIGRKKPVEGKVVYLMMYKVSKTSRTSEPVNSRIHGTGILYLRLGSLGVNVGKYTIHWASGIVNKSPQVGLRDPFQMASMAYEWGSQTAHWDDPPSRGGRRGVIYIYIYVYIHVYIP